MDSSSDRPVVLKEVAQERSRAALAEDFDALYTRYKRKVFGTVRNVIGPTQELEDIVQTVFMEIHRSLPRYKGTGPVVDVDLPNRRQRIAPAHTKTETTACLSVPYRVPGTKRKSPKS